VCRSFRPLIFCWLAGLIFAPASPAQIDPEKRQLIQFGYSQPLEGHGPVSGYAYYYLNQPDFGRTNLTLRLAIAPVYLDSELGLSHAFGPRTDLAFGLAGGGFADSFYEVRRGTFLEGESFTGHGAEASVSLYHLFNPGREIPLNAVLRVSPHYSVFERNHDTAAAFVLPADHPALHVRSGLRWGGREPLLSPALAMEMSIWYEAQWRSHAGAFGLGGDRSLQASSHLFWGRALLAYTLPESEQSFTVSLTTGTSIAADRFSSYRLGGALPLASEFPLQVPGYYYQEISARRFVLLSGQYSVPLDRARCWSVNALAATAVVDYVAGLNQPGNWHSGVSGGLGYRSPQKVWQVMAGYAYGLDALRARGRGAHSIGMLVQYDLETRHHLKKTDLEPDLRPDKSGLLERLFRHF
jgi:hypothetical protein